MSFTRSASWVASPVSIQQGGIGIEGFSLNYMKQVRFFHIEKGDVNYLGRVVLKEGKIRFDGLPDGLTHRLREGLVRWSRPRKRFLPKDGLDFVRSTQKQRI